MSDDHKNLYLAHYSLVPGGRYVATLRRTSAIDVFSEGDKTVSGKQRNTDVEKLQAFCINSSLCFQAV